MCHPFELLEDYCYAESQVLKNLCQKNYHECKIPVNKTFHIDFSLINTMTVWSKVLLHLNYIFSLIFKPKVGSAYYTQLCIIFSKIWNFIKHAHTILLTYTQMCFTTSISLNLCCKGIVMVKLQNVV